MACGNTPMMSDQQLRARIVRPVVLVGMMGSGKTSIGRRMAQRLSLRFADADEEIEAAAGMSVSEILERFGEPNFRDGERRVIARLLESGPMVLSTGGGAFAQADTRAEILSAATVIWLDASLRTLVERTRRRNHRPLLQTGDPAQTLARLLDERAPAYAQAHIRIASDSAPHHRAVDLAVNALKDYLA